MDRSPPPPPEPRHTWRTAAYTALFVGITVLAMTLLMRRWAVLQDYSEEMRAEGYHRFAGTMMPPETVAGSPVVKFRIKTDAGDVVTLPAMEDVDDAARGDAPPLSAYPEGTCVEGYARHHKGFMSEVVFRVDGWLYMRDGDVGWMVRKDPDGPPTG